MRKTLYCLIFLLLTPHMAFAQYHQWTKLKGGHFFAVSKEAYDRAWSFIDARDEEAINKMFLIRAIIKTTDGMEVYVEETHFLHGSAEIRFRGDAHIYWILSEALYSTDSTVPHEPVVEKKQINKNACKLDGVMVDNGKPLIFVSQRGKVDSVKIGDHICDCGGEVIRGYAPGEVDGLTDGTVDKYEYRIKVRINEEEKIFKNGDVICEGEEQSPLL